MQPITSNHGLVYRSAPNILVITYISLFTADGTVIIKR